MQELFKLTLSLHIWFLIVFVIFSFVGLVLVGMKFKNNTYAKRIRLFFPAYYFLFSCVFFTGVVLLAIYKFQMSVYVFLMILAWVFILATSILSYKKFKTIAQKHKVFKIFATQKFISEILIIIAFLVI